MNTYQSVRPVQRTALVIAIAGALVLLSTGAAMAQQAPTQETPAQEPPASTQPAQTGAAEPQDATTLGAVIVTANKRAENVREVASSISVVSEEQLDNLHVTQLTDFAAYVPGLQVTGSGTPGKTSISLRGISPISSGATVASYIDEIPVGSSANFQSAVGLSLDLLPYDIARVEILRGPQGTLYGANAMGGVVKYVTREPDLNNSEFRIGGGVSDTQGAGDLGFNMRLGGNVVLAEDSVALRVSYARNNIAGFIDNAVDGREDINDGSQESARVALLMQGDDVSLTLTAVQQSIDSDNNALVALGFVGPAPLGEPVTPGAPLVGDLSNRVAVDEPFSKDVDLYSATLQWDLGWADFTSASGYTDLHTENRTDFTFVLGDFPLLVGLPPGISFFDQVLDLTKFTQEFRLTSTTDGPFQWQLGAFYTEEEGDNVQVARVQATDGTPTPILDPALVAELPSDYKETAVFGNASYAFSDRFELGAGVRFSRNEQAFAQISAGGSLLAPGTTTGSSDEDVFNWSLSPKFQLTEDAMLYARIATGYQPGGPNVALPDVPPSVDASTLTSYELGLKSEFLDRRVLIDVAAYYIEWKDIQVVAATIDGLTFLVNGDEAVSQGVELSAAFQATDRLQLGLNAAYSDATLSDPVPSIGGLAGDQLPFIPEFSWSATAYYTFPLRGDWSGRVGGGYRWVGERKTGAESSTAVLPLDSYGALDLSADLSNEHWTLRAYARNATDERAYLVMAEARSAVTGALNHLVATPIQPRTIGLEVDYRF